MTCLPFESLREGRVPVTGLLPVAKQLRCFGGSNPRSPNHPRRSFPIPRRTNTPISPFPPGAPNAYPALAAAVVVKNSRRAVFISLYSGFWAPIFGFPDPLYTRIRERIVLVKSSYNSMKLLPASILAAALILNAFGENPQATIDGTAPGWRAMTEEDFTAVNCKPETWTFHKDGTINCTGKPVGVIRTKKELTNFELVLEWRHNKPAGNSGVFVWAIPSSIKTLEAGQGRLPQGIEVQVLDLAYGGKNPADWYTSHGDVFPVGAAKMTPFAPVAPNGKRSFPSAKTTKGVGEWNHYYIRAINGEVRLWVNGTEVSGGTNCKPATGFLCLESEGSPIDFRNLRLRELP